jgi:hypothetical protein
MEIKKTNEKKVIAERKDNTMRPSLWKRRRKIKKIIA